MARDRSNLRCLSLCERLSKARRQRGLSQNRLSLQAGLGSSTAQMIEQGERLPGVDIAEKLADALAVSPSWLCFGEGAQSPEVFDWWIEPGIGLSAEAQAPAPEAGDSALLDRVAAHLLKWVDDSALDLVSLGLGDELRGLQLAERMVAAGKERLTLFLVEADVLRLNAAYQRARRSFQMHRSARAKALWADFAHLPAFVSHLHSPRFAKRVLVLGPALAELAEPARFAREVVASGHKEPVSAMKVGIRPPACCRHRWPARSRP